ncbi:p-hydroxybenzoic acid efflux pump subunit AaeA [Pirellulimonas nuda]|uniref:p-hydroxybenzoic acid efflux pump subunit AaeA n=2 Tax=Pirellulimonas nuda TaxID=2528009 RepID=A0A518DAH5_9BACT|nr:p-hydroxybenzoic acid efflux pump subunit AaeA [Pirellulimonas nuda]
MKPGKHYNEFGSKRRWVCIGLYACVVACCAGASAASDAAIEVPSAILTAAQSVEAPAPEAGVLVDLSVREGSTVKAGQVIGRIDGAAQQLAIEQVEADLAMARRESKSDIRVRLAEKEHQVARVELQRALEVNSGFANTVSAKEVDRLRLAVERTALEIEHAGFEREMLALKIARTEADLRLARHELQRLVVRSPASGVVAEVVRHGGEWADKGELIARVVRVDLLRAEGYLDVQDAVLGSVGRPVRVHATLAGGGEAVANGRVVFVSPEAEPVNSQVRFWAEIDNAAMKLRPGLSVSITILPPRGDAEKDGADALTGGAPTAVSLPRSR